MIKNLARMCGCVLILSCTQWSGAAILSELNQPKVDARLILGKWQCEYEDAQLGMWIEDEYRSDGRYFLRGYGQEKAQFTPLTFELTLEARWQLDGNKVSYKEIKLTKVESNNDHFRTLLEGAYKNYTLIESRIENITESSMTIRTVAPVYKDYVNVCQKQ